MNDADLEQLRANRLFSEMSESARESLFEDVLVLDMQTGTTLFRQGEDARFMHVVLSGRVALLGKFEDKGETVVEFFDVDDVFIVPAVILAAPYLMSARTVENSRIVMVPAQRFRDMLERDHALAVAGARELSHHWRLLIRQVKDLKLRSAPQRLGSYLLGMADTEALRASIELPEPRGLLARRLGMTPENLSRAFARLRELSVTARGRKIELGDVPALRSFCGYEDVT